MVYVIKARGMCESLRINFDIFTFILCQTQVRSVPHLMLNLYVYNVEYPIFWFSYLDFRVCFTIMLLRLLFSDYVDYG